MEYCRNNPSILRCYVGFNDSVDYQSTLTKVYGWQSTINLVNFLTIVSRCFLNINCLVSFKSWLTRFTRETTQKNSINHPTEPNRIEPCNHINPTTWFLLYNKHQLCFFFSYVYFPCIVMLLDWFLLSGDCLTNSYSSHSQISFNLLNSNILYQPTQVLQVAFKWVTINFNPASSSRYHFCFTALGNFFS